MGLDAWMEWANCRGANVDLFFPERGLVISREVRAICTDCTVSRECMDYADRHHIHWGIWGGQTREMRRHQTKQQREQEQRHAS